MERKPFDQMTDAEQNELMDEWIRKANANPVCVTTPAEVQREGHYHASPDCE